MGIFGYFCEIFSGILADPVYNKQNIRWPLGLGDTNFIATALTRERYYQHSKTKSSISVFTSPPTPHHNVFRSETPLSTVVSTCEAKLKFDKKALFKYCVLMTLNIFLLTWYDNRKDIQIFFFRKTDYSVQLSDCDSCAVTCMESHLCQNYKWPV